MKRRNAKKSAKSEMKCCDCNNYGKKCSGGIYGLGFIGAVIYYLSVAPNFWWGVLGFLKALVWPVFLVLELLKYVGA